VAVVTAAFAAYAAAEEGGAATTTTAATAAPGHGRVGPTPTCRCFCRCTAGASTRQLLTFALQVGSSLVSAAEVSGHRGDCFALSSDTGWLVQKRDTPLPPHRHASLSLSLTNRDTPRGPARDTEAVNQSACLWQLTGRSASLPCSFRTCRSTADHCFFLDSLAQQSLCTLY
jgi:hypothetical protein